MRKSLCIIALASAVIFAPTILRASDITYTVDETVGAGSITGFITTDGTIGVLGIGDFDEWDLTLNDGSNPTFELLGPGLTNNSEETVAGSDLSASATQLLYNFDASDGGAFLFESLTIGDAGPFVCWATGDCSGNPAGVSLAAQQDEPDEIFAPLSGTVAIGDATVTPEPSSLLLFGTGLVGFAGVLRRKFAQTLRAS
jgi:hypothetical protein